MKAYDNYKQSHVDWIGEIPNNWSITKLKFISNIYNGNSLNDDLKEKFESEDLNNITYIGTKDVEQDTGKINLENGIRIPKNEGNFRIAPKGSFVLCIEGGSAGKKIGYLNEDVYFVNKLACFDYENKFLYYYVLSDHFKNQFFNSLSGLIGGVSISLIRNFYSTFPSKNEQIQIASFLDYKTNLIDATIEKKKHLIELLKEKRQAVINEAVTKGLNPNAPIKDSGVEWLGEIPEHWGLVPLRYLYNKIGSGVTPKGGGDVYTDEGVTFIRSQNVHFDGLRLDDVVKIDIETHQKMNNSSVEFNDVLLNITGASIGRCCVVNIDEEMNVNQHVCIIRVNERIKPDFLNIVLQSNVGQTQIKLLTTGGNREGLTQEAVKNMSIPLPNIETQIQLLNSITEKLKSFDLIKNKIETAIEKLQTYRQSLISEAVTGKIDVRDWEKVKN